MMKLDANWTNDCSGKMDLDAEIVYLSTRFYPRTGGFYINRGAELVEASDYAGKLFDANATGGFYLRGLTVDGEEVHLNLIHQDFKGEDEEEVRAQYKAWAETVYQRIYKALKQEFGIQDTQAPTT